MTSTAPTGSPMTNVSTSEVGFQHIPDLWDLDPPRGGWPGVTYVQVCAHNAARAQAQGYTSIIGGVFYSITGTKGSASMVLMGKGRPIPGASPDAGARMLLTDTEVERLTGHLVDPEFALDLKEVSDGEVSESAAPGASFLPENTGLEERGLAGDPEPQDREGAAGGPGPQPVAGSGKGRRDPPAPKGALK